MIPNNKRIALLHPQLAKKWWAVHMMIHLGNIFSQKHNQVTFYTFSYDESVFWQEIEFSVFIGNGLTIAKEIKNADYIWIGNSPMQFIGALSKLIWGNAKVYWWHHHYPWYYEKNAKRSVFLKKYLEKLALHYIDALIWNSEYLCRVLKKIYTKPVFLLSPIVDKTFLYAKMSTNILLKQKQILLSYSRWVAWKNLWQIFDTYESLKSKFPKLEIYIGGVWEEQEYYQKRYKKDCRVHFLWMLTKEEAVYYLQHSDIFLFPSKVDSFWMSAIEAMVLWVPVICFWWKWLDEVIRNGKNGFCVSSKIDFTQKTEFLLRHPVLKKIFWEQAKVDAWKYSSTRFEEQLGKIFL